MRLDEVILFSPLLFLFFFTGLLVGWCLAKGRYFLLLISMVLFAPLIDFIIQANYWVSSSLFLVGFFVHTAKPLYQRVTERW